MGFDHRGAELLPAQTLSCYRLIDPGSEWRLHRYWYQNNAVMAGNTADNTTLHGFLGKIEKQYGKAQRIWVMDRGIPTEEVLDQMRRSDPPIHYLVGTPKGRLSRYRQVGQGHSPVPSGARTLIIGLDKEALRFVSSPLDRSCPRMSF